MKLRRGYTHDREGMLVELNCTSRHARIILEARVPIRIAEHDIRSAVVAVLIGSVEYTAKIGMNPEHIEVVSAHFIDPDAG